MQNFIKRIIIIPVLLSLLAAGPIKCSDLDMATDGICENCFEGMSRDSVYTVIYCYGVGKNTNISILQLMNTSVPVLLKAKDVALYRDDVALYQAALNDLRPNQKFFIECPDGSKVIPPCSFLDEVMREGAGRWRWSKDKF